MNAPTEEIEKTAALLKLLGDKTRLGIAGLLEHGECCVCELVDIFQISQPAVSQHLRKLRDAGLVTERRSGQWVFYSMNKQHPMYPLVQTLLDRIPVEKEKWTAWKAAGRDISCCN